MYSNLMFRVDKKQMWLLLSLRLNLTALLSTTEIIYVKRFIITYGEFEITGKKVITIIRRHCFYSLLDLMKTIKSISKYSLCFGRNSNRVQNTLYKEWPLMIKMKEWLIKELGARGYLVHGLRWYNKRFSNKTTEFFHRPEYQMK
jgi:hypothetical protein